MLGWVLLTRPYDAVLWGVVLVTGAVVLHRLDGLRRLWPVVLAGIPFVVATLAYNLRVTGEALTFPIVAADPLDTFGLGTRRLMPDFRPVHYGLGLATRSTAKNSFFFVVFLAGNVVTVGLALFGTWMHRRRREAWVLLVLGAIFPLGYFVFWGTNVSSFTARLVGSIYYVPSIVPIVVLAVLGAIEVRRRSIAWFRISVGLVVLLTVPVMVSRLGVEHRISTVQRAWSDSIDGLDGPALVITASSGPYVMFENPFARNGPELDDEILYAVDLGTENFDTIAAHPDRTPYLQVASAHPDELAPKEDPVPLSVHIEPIEVVTASRISLSGTFRPIDGAPVVRPYVYVGGRVRWARSTAATAHDDGTWTMSWTFGPDDLPPGRSLLRVGFGAGADASGARAAPIIRWEIPVDVRAGQVTALVPAQQFVRFPVGDEFRWYPRPDYPASFDVSGSG